MTPDAAFGHERRGTPDALHDARGRAGLRGRRRPAVPDRRHARSAARDIRAADRGRRPRRRGGAARAALCGRRRPAGGRGGEPRRSEARDAHVPAARGAAAAGDVPGARRDRVGAGGVPSSEPRRRVEIVAPEEPGWVEIRADDPLPAASGACEITVSRLTPIRPGDVVDVLRAPRSPGRRPLPDETSSASPLTPARRASSATAIAIRREMPRRCGDRRVEPAVIEALGRDRSPPRRPPRPGTSRP